MSALILAALVFAALPLRAEVFHDPLCEKLPEVNPGVKAWVARVAPELARVRVRELPDKAALDVFGRAAEVGWGSIDVLTHDVFREPCTFYLSRKALRAVDATFDVNFLTPIRGRDMKGRDFEMAAMLAGRGKLVAFYERDGIVYRNQKQDRNFQLASRVEFDTPVAGVLESIRGLCARVWLLGCVRVHSMVKAGETIEVRVGTFTSESPLTPIKAREPGSASRSSRSSPAHEPEHNRRRTATSRRSPPHGPDLHHRHEYEEGTTWLELPHRRPCLRGSSEFRGSSESALSECGHPGSGDTPVC